MSTDPGTRAELAELTRSVEEMVAAVYPDDAASRFADAPVLDRAAWQRVGGELDLIGLHLPTARGGQGQPFAVHAAVVAALGRRLSPSPHLPVLGSALTLLAHGADEHQRQRWLPDVLSGRTVVAVGGLDRAWDESTRPSPALTVEEADGVCTLRGSTDPILHGAEADLVVLVVGTRVLVVDPSDAGARTEPVEALDLTRPRATLHLDGVVAEPLAAAGPELVRRALLEATVLQAVEAAAAARSCLTRTVEYVGVRTQFDRPIGSFQAVQHALADLFGEVVSAEAAVGLAVEALSTDAHDAAEDAVRVSAVAANEAFCRASRESIHLHGGIGFTWEHDAHLSYRRALTDRALLGDPTTHRRALARALVASA